MKIISWIHWFFFVCICFSEAKNKIRRPLIPPYPPPALMLKKFRPFNRPISHRISMRNTIHIDNSHQRIPYINHRIHRPTMYNILSTNWKNQIPIRAFLNKHIVLPQQIPAKEFNSIHQIPEYKPERRSELVVLPSIHQENIDDDKGPIHTIPAPNLSSIDKFHNLATNTKTLANNPPYSNPMLIGLELATINKNLSQQRRRIATSSISPQHQYEVTESNDMALKEHQSVQLSQAQQDLNITELSSSLINPRQQLNGFFSNHLVNSNPSIAKPNVEFIQPMQTNLHSSLYVGLPSTVIQIPYVEQQIPDLHVDHSTPAESFLSATQLYEFSNNFPSKFAEQYMSDQQQILQQQLDQSYQPNAETSFSQPQMHPFNYNEANKLQQQEPQKQQKISFDQDYVSKDITENYNLDSREKKKQSLVNIPEQNDNVEANKKLTYSTNKIEQSGNNIEYEEINYQKNPTIYFDRNVDPTKFYTILPNRETAEKLAALAAAGNINSRLIGQLRKQQQNNVQENLIPFNHKSIGDDNINKQVNVDQQKYNQHELHKNQHPHKQTYEIKDDKKLPLQITVLDDYVTSDDDQQNSTRENNMDMEYEYEIQNDEI